jgi:hypothetical protein
MCKCLGGCSILQDTYVGQGPLVCEQPLLILPNFGLYWGPRLIQQQVTWAKEKLAYEAGKGYEDGAWKMHVLAYKNGAVSAFYGLLGMSLNVIKANYIGFVTGRSMALGAEGKCDLAKCIAYCTASCESMCSELDGTDEAFLATISWTKGMCDLDASKETIKQACEGVKASVTTFSASKGLPAAKECDAKCDGAFSNSALVAFLPIVMGLLVNMS